MGAEKEEAEGQALFGQWVEPSSTLALQEVLEYGIFYVHKRCTCIIYMTVYIGCVEFQNKADHWKNTHTPSVADGTAGVLIDVK